METHEQINSYRSKDKIKNSADEDVCHSDGHLQGLLNEGGDPLGVDTCELLRLLILFRAWEKEIQAKKPISELVRGADATHLNY